MAREFFARGVTFAILVVSIPFVVCAIVLICIFDDGFFDDPWRPV